MHRSVLIGFVFFIICHHFVSAQFSPCDSLICESPKVCRVENDIAQCVLAPGDNSLFSNILGSALGNTPETAAQINVGQQSGFSPPPQPTTAAPGLLGLFGNAPSAGENNPLAPFLNLFTLPTAAGTTPPTIPPFQTLAPASAAPIHTTTVAPASTSTIKAEPDVCILPPLTGNCQRARIMWYYDNETQNCERFSFSGCGNSNRFESRKACETRCIKR